MVYRERWVTTIIKNRKVGYTIEYWDGGRIMDLQDSFAFTRKGAEKTARRTLNRLNWVPDEEWKIK